MASYSDAVGSTVEIFISAADGFGIVATVEARNLASAEADVVQKTSPKQPNTNAGKEETKKWIQGQIETLKSTYPNARIEIAGTNPQGKTVAKDLSSGIGGASYLDDAFGSSAEALPGTGESSQFQAALEAADDPITPMSNEEIQRLQDLENNNRTEAGNQANLDALKQLDPAKAKDPFYAPAQDREGAENSEILNNIPIEDQIKYKHGLACSPVEQAVANRINGDLEHTITNEHNNCWIVLGSNRRVGLTTGKGGSGETHCDEITITAGFGGHSPISKVTDSDGQEQQAYTNPSLDDAAVIKVSQRTDVDEEFHLASGETGKINDKSAIALYADGIRLIARETMKLATGCGPAKNSQGGSNISVSGIELIAGNDDSDMQPLVKGNNLREALEVMLKQIERVSKILHGFAKYQMKFNEAVATHTHFSPFYGIPTSISPGCSDAGFLVNFEVIGKTEASVITQQSNFAGVIQTYLRPGNKYICSTNNRVN